MRRLPISLLLPLFSFFLMQPSVAPAAENVDLIVRFQADMSENAIDNFLRDQDAVRVGEPTRLNIVFVDLPADTTPTEGRTAFQKDPDVRYAERNADVTALQVQRFPNDDDLEFDRQWGLHQDVSNLIGLEDADIDAPEAWNVQTGSANVVVAVLDTGVDVEHEDLEFRLWENPGEIENNNDDDDGNELEDDFHGWNFVDDTEELDVEGAAQSGAFASHGTHIAGIIGADTDNNIGVAGVDWSAPLMILKVLDEEGNGTADNVIRAIAYAIDKGARIIQAGWGLTDYSQALYDTIADARSEGILVVAAAGNSTTVLYPALFNLDNIIAVTATNANDALASVTGAGNPATGVEDVDLGAPGLEVHSTLIDDAYGLRSGTSQAAAFVTGAVALLLADNLSQSLDLLKARLLSSVDNADDDVVGLTGVTVSGGRLNAYNALVPPEDRAVFIVPFGAAIHAEDADDDPTEVQFTLEGDTAVDWDVDCTADAGSIDRVTGLFTADGPGSCTISATGSGTPSSDIREVTIYIKQIVVEESDQSTLPGQNITLTASGGTAPYTWISSEPDVLEVSSSAGSTATVTGLKAGSAEVRATDARGFSGVSEELSVLRGKKSGHCILTTALFGSPWDRHLETLRAFRDRYLKTNPVGRKLVRFYERHSSALADQIEGKPPLKSVVRLAILPVIALSWLMLSAGLSWGGLGALTLGSAAAAGLLVRSGRRRRLPGRTHPSVSPR